MAIKANNSHDLSFIKQDGSTEIGLMLAKDKNGVPIYGEFDDPSLAQQFFSGEPGYANLPPEKEIQIGQDDWRSGVGQEIFDTSDKKRYWKSVNMDLRFKGIAQCGPLATAITKPAGVVRAWAEFNGKLWIGVDDQLCYLDTGTDEFTLNHDFADGKNITDLEAFTDDYLYIARGKDNKYCRMPTTEDAWSESGQADGKADYFQTYGTTLAKACKPREVKTATAPEGAGWTTEYTIGSTADDITDMKEESGTLYIMKEDMPYYIDTVGAVQRLIPGLKTLTSTTSGVNSFVWKAKLYIPCGTQSLVEYGCVAETQLWRDPADFCDNLTEYTGRVQALTGDDRYLYAITDNDTKVELLAGRLEEIDGSTDWVWHPLSELTLTGCQIAFASSIHKKRLYVASTNSADSFYYYPLPTTYGDIDSDANYAFQTDGYFITPWHHANFKADYKAYIKITLNMGGAIDTNIYFEGHYRIKGVSAWTDIGDFQTAPRTTKYIPVTTGTGLNPTGIMIQFKFVAKTNDTSTTPKLLGYDCRGIWYPTKRWVIGATVQCADNLTLKNGGIDSQTASTIKTALEEADGATYPVTFYDVTGSEIYVKFLSLRGHWYKVEKDRNPEWVYDLILTKVTTTLTGTARSWDAQWDSFVWQ